MSSGEAGQAVRVKIDPLKYFHLMLPAQKNDLPLSAIRLVLKVDGWKAGNTVNVRVHDPFNIWRTLGDVDVQLTAAGGMDSGVGSVLPLAIFESPDIFSVSSIALRAK